jgi:multidrug efflux pump subunit AcrA (membrane-fusion protein)
MGVGRVVGRMGRRGLAVVVVVLLAVAATGVWLLTRPDNAAAAQTVTATVTAGTYQQTVSGTGTLAPTRQADLDFAVSGRVTQVLVNAGDKVAKGDVLARLDTTSLDAALDSAQAQLDAAQAQYDDDVDADAADTQLAADRAAVAAAESSLSQAQDDLDAATLKATFSGTVASVDIAVGDQVSGTSSSGSDPSASDSSDSSTGTTSAVVVVAPRHFKVVADVAADDITKVKKGMQAQVTPTGASQPVYGTVTSVGLVAQSSSSGAATFPVTVTITSAQSKLYAGTSTTVSIVTRQVSNVLAVPTLALHTSGSTTYVEKLVDGKKVRTTVTIGQTYGTNTQVTKGLKEGDKVVLATVRLPSGGNGNGNGRNGEFQLPGGEGGNGPSVDVQGGGPGTFQNGSGGGQP